jgi:large conductance mechanosensitive channel
MDVLQEQGLKNLKRGAHRGQPGIVTERELLFQAASPTARRPRWLKSLAALIIPLQVHPPTQKEHAMGMMQEFKEFAVKGNVIDLAVGVIIGAAFGKIVDSVVGDLIMPVVGAVIGKLDFSNMFWIMGSVPPGTGMTLDALKKAGVPVFAYGNFITVAVNFVILAFIIFLMVKQINRLKRNQPAPVPAPVATPEDVVLLREIRDSLKK